MSRITYRDEYGDVRPEFGYTLADAVEKLAHYEDLEEQGRLIPADKIKSKIAGHSVYYGGHILDAIQCMAEGKEVGNVRYLEPEDIVRLAGGWVTGCVPTKSGNYAVRYNGIEGRDDFTTEGNHWWNVGRLHHPEEVEWKPASFKEL